MTNKALLFSINFRYTDFKIIITRKIVVARTTHSVYIMYCRCRSHLFSPLSSSMKSIAINTTTRKRTPFVTNATCTYDVYVRTVFLSDGDYASYVI